MVQLRAMIQLVGPGGAGKSTTGALLATRLGLSFLDLDAHLASDIGDLSAFMARVGYEVYAHENVAAYRALLDARPLPGVLAVSSGFMTYARDVHPDYARIRDHLACSPKTIVLLPSMELEACVAEIVHRQVGRPFARSAAREEEVIRARFDTYIALPARRIATMRSPEEVVETILAALEAEVRS